MSKIKKEEVSKVGLEIVACAGEARSSFILAFEKAALGKMDEAEKLVIEANKSLKLAHDAQFSMIQKEAQGNTIEYSFIMAHGQDHLMTTYILRDLFEVLKPIFNKK